MGQTTPGWVVLDVGEVLIDETRVWTTWAQVLGVPPFTLMAVLGATVTAGGDHREAFTALGADGWQGRQAEFEERYGGFTAADLYPDVQPMLAALRAARFRIGVIGNQPARRHAELRALGVEADIMAMSEELGVEKPDPRFFARVSELAGEPAERITYVGDRVDNDVLPALAAGMRVVWLRQGPWGVLQRLPDGVTVPEAADLREVAGRVKDGRLG